MRKTAIIVVMVLCSCLAFADSVKTNPYYTNIYTKGKRTAFIVGNRADVSVDFAGFTLGNSLSYSKLFSNFSQVKGDVDLIGASGFVDSQYFGAKAFLLNGSSDSVKINVNDYNVDLKNLHFLYYSASPEVRWQGLKLFSSFKGLISNTNMSNLALFQGALDLNGFHSLDVGFAAGPASFEYIRSKTSFNINNSGDVKAVKLKADLEGFKGNCDFKFKHFNMNAHFGFFALDLDLDGNIDELSALYSMAMDYANLKATGSTVAMMLGFDFDVPFKHSDLKINPYYVQLFETSGQGNASWQFGDLFSSIFSSWLGSNKTGNASFSAKIKSASLIVMNIKYDYKLGDLHIGTSRLIPVPLIGKIETNKETVKPKISVKNFIKNNWASLLFAGVSVYVSYSK